MKFLKLALLLAILAVGSSWSAAETTGISIGLSQYSLRKLFNEKALDPLDYPAFAQREFGIRTIDVYEGGLPRDRLDNFDYLRELRRRAESIGSTIFLWMGGVVDATGASIEARENAFEVHLASLKRAEVVGCTYLRVFLKAPLGERAAAVRHSAEALRPLASVAKAKGVILVIEPGASRWSAQGDFLAEVMREMDHSHCRLMPDFGKLAGEIYAGTKAMMPYAAVISAKTHEFHPDGNQVDFDYSRLMRIIVEAKFRGVIALEWEGKLLPPVDGTRASQRLVERTLKNL
jgi:sugar phosphate isomerase/epimerase